jgi:hypothetical protein
MNFTDTKNVNTNRGGSGNGSTSREVKDSVDVCIVGGQNSLKKKIHYAFIAHIYTALLQMSKKYF